MIRKLSLLSATLMGVGMLGAAPAYAAYSWSFTSCANNGTYTMGNQCTDGTGSNPSGGPTLTADAYANTGTSGALETAHADLYGGGIGVSNNKYGSTNTAEQLNLAPEHATDNKVFTDSILLNFNGDSVALTDITMGWIGSSSYSTTLTKTNDASKTWATTVTNTDADFALLRYTGSDAPTLVGSTYAALVAGGWELIDHYSTSAMNTPVSVNAAGKSSSYWLVAADITLGSSSALTDTLCKDKYQNGTYKGTYCTTMFTNDFFKLASVAGNYTKPPEGGPSVPEPGSLALLGLGSLLLVGARTKKAKR